VRVGVVDMGSNSTRLLVADVAPGAAAPVEVRRAAVVTRLGDGLERTGRLDPGAQARVFAVLEEYVRTLRELHCATAVAVMTSAVRDAANGVEFASAVRARTGLDARILSGAEEAGATFAGAAAAKPGSDTRALAVIDIGGGSTELVTGAGFHASTQVGVVRHSERHLRTDPPAGAELGALAADVRDAFRAAVPVAVASGVREAVAVAGTATSCAAMDLAGAAARAAADSAGATSHTAADLAGATARAAIDPAAIEGHVLTARALDALRDRLAAMTETERRAVPGLHPDRAPTIVAGVIVLREALGALDLDAVTVSDRDLLWGTALALAQARLEERG